MNGNPDCPRQIKQDQHEEWIWEQAAEIAREDLQRDPTVEEIQEYVDDWCEIDPERDPDPGRTADWAEIIYGPER